MSTAKAAGSEPVATSTAETSSGPRSAPARSRDLWTAKPRPRPTGPATRGEQHGFRRAADGFAYPVPDDEHGRQGHPGGPGERRQRQQRDAHRSQHIAGHRESPVLPGAVRPGAEHQPESLGRGFRGAGHEADEQRGRTELGQQGTAERAGAVGHHVRGEADQAEADNRAPQPVPPIPGLASGPRRRVLLAGWHPAPGPFHFLRLTDGPEKDNTQVRGLSPRRGAEGNIGQRGSFWAAAWYFLRADPYCAGRGDPQ